MRTPPSPAWSPPRADRGVDDRRRGGGPVWSAAPFRGTSTGCVCPDHRAPGCITRSRIRGARGWMQGSSIHIQRTACIPLKKCGWPSTASHHLPVPDTARRLVPRRPPRHASAHYGSHPRDQRKRHEKTPLTPLTPCEAIPSRFPAAPDRAGWMMSIQRRNPPPRRARKGPHPATLSAIPYSLFPIPYSLSPQIFQLTPNTGTSGTEDSCRTTSSPLPVSE